MIILFRTPSAVDECNCKFVWFLSSITSKTGLTSLRRQHSSIPTLHPTLYRRHLPGGETVPQPGDEAGQEDLAVLAARNTVDHNTSSVTQYLTLMVRGELTRTGGRQSELFRPSSPASPAQWWWCGTLLPGRLLLSGGCQQADSKHCNLQIVGFQLENFTKVPN